MGVVISVRTDADTFESEITIPLAKWLETHLPASIEATQAIEIVRQAPMLVRKLEELEARLAKRESQREAMRQLLADSAA